MKKSGLILLILLLALGAVFAQRYFRGGFGRGGYGGGTMTRHRRRRHGGREHGPHCARNRSHSTGTPDWTNAPGFEKDVFTFVRIIRDRDSERLQQRRQLDHGFPRQRFEFLVSAPASHHHPHRSRRPHAPADGSRTCSIIHGFTWSSRARCCCATRKSRSCGNICSTAACSGLTISGANGSGSVSRSQIKRVFPDRDFVELPMDHPIFHCVFDIKVPKNKLQTPALTLPCSRHSTDFTWEDFHRTRRRRLDELPGHARPRHPGRQRPHHGPRHARLRQRRQLGARRRERVVLP